jgi:hypothetical protein
VFGMLVALLRISPVGNGGGLRYSGHDEPETVYLYRSVLPVELPEVSRDSFEHA